MGTFCGSGVGNRMGDLPPLVCCGWIPLDVVAVDVGANVVRGDVVGSFWSYVPWLCEPCLIFL